MVEDVESEESFMEYVRRIKWRKKDGVKEEQKNSSIKAEDFGNNAEMIV